MVLKEWLGKESIEEIPKNLKNEIEIIDSLLEGVQYTEKLERIESIERAIKKQKIKGKICLEIEEKIREFLKPYIKGKKKVGHKFSLTQVLFLSRILREFDEEDIWRELKDLWKKELQILKNMVNEDRLEEIVKKQKEILELLKEINSLEYNETHMHIGQSADPDIHWEFFKKYWILSEKQKIPKGLNIILEYKKSVEEGSIRKEDFIKLKNIMNHFLSKNPENKWSETKAFLEFSKLLILEEKISGSFTSFEQKANIFNVIDEIADRVAISKKQNINKEYVLGKFESIAKHCINQGITHIEIRGGGADIVGIKSLIDYAKIIEKKYENKLRMRFITFGKDKPEEIIKMYNSLPKGDRKYVVALDLMRFTDVKDIIKFAKNSPLPLCVHAGEFYGKNDIGFKGLKAIERIEKSLNQVNRCVESKAIHRIGHANILAQDIDKYIKKEQKINLKNKEKIKDLEKLKQEIINKIKKRKIVIEANPTSNIRVVGLKYEEHPIKLFDEKKIPYAISTDDRVTFNTNLKKEYLRIFRAMKWQIKDLKRVNEISKKAKLG